MHNEHCPRTAVRSKSLLRLAVIPVIAACLGPVEPAAGQTERPDVPMFNIRSEDETVTFSLTLGVELDAPMFNIRSEDESLTVVWVDVANADSYDVRWKSGTEGYSTSRLAEDIEDTHYTIDGLTNGREYTVQVRATNSLTNSAWASERTQTPSEEPAGPVLRLTPGNGSITVSWDAVPSATSYDIYWFQVGNDSNDATIGGITTTSYTITDLEPGRYTVVGWARNTYGHSSSTSPGVVGAPWPSITVADASAIEGSAVEFAVTLSHAFSESVTVQYGTSDGTATADPNAADGADYTAVTAGTLTFSANDTEETISIATGDDMVKEADETFTVTLSNPSSNALLGTMKTATGTIRNDDLEPGTVGLCGARVGTPKSRRRDAEVDMCWEAGGAIPTGSDVVIEARERYFWYDGEPFGPWREVARGDSFTACGGDDTCVQYTRAATWRGLAFEMELRVRRGGSVLATSAPLKAHVPNGDTNVLRAELSLAIEENTGQALDAPDGPFVMELQFTDPYLYAYLPEIVMGLETADFEVTNATVTDVRIWDESGTYKVSVAPTTLGEPVTIGLPANRVKGVGEGISASGGNNYTRDNTASNTVVQETTGPGNRRRSTGPPLTAEFEDEPKAHRGRGTFKVRLRFSEPVGTSYRTLRDRAVTVVGGRVRRADRVKGRNDLWTIVVAPGSNRPVTLRVVSRGACGSSRAVCTEDGRALSNSPTLTIDGPGAGNGLGGPDFGESAPPVNRPPRAVGTIPPQVLGLEDAELMLDVAPYFADEDAAGMAFRVESADPVVAAVSLAGSLLAVSAAGPGTSLVTVTARDAEGLTAAQAFAVRVADRWGGDGRHAGGAGAGLPVERAVDVGPAGGVAIAGGGNDRGGPAGTAGPGRGAGGGPVAGVAAASAGGCAGWSAWCGGACRVRALRIRPAVQPTGLPRRRGRTSGAGRSSLGVARLVGPGVAGSRARDGLAAGPFAGASGLAGVRPPAHGLADRLRGAGPVRGLGLAGVAEHERGPAAGRTGGRGRRGGDGGRVAGGAALDGVGAGRRADVPRRSDGWCVVRLRLRRGPADGLRGGGRAAERGVADGRVAGAQFRLGQLELGPVAGPAVDGADRGASLRAVVAGRHDGVGAGRHGPRGGGERRARG